MADLIAPPSTIDEFAAYIAAVVSEKYSSSHQPTNGAVLAEKIRHQFPSFSVRQLGLVKLAEAVDYAERQGLVVRNRSVKHLEISPPESKSTASAPVSPLGAPPHVRTDIWQAFVFVTSGLRRFFDRHSRLMVDGQTLSQDLDNSRYVPVEPISLEQQRRWMEQFLQGRTSLDAATAPIRESHCFIAFPNWLREKDTNLDREWKQFRVQQVVDQINKWATQNEIDTTGFFSIPFNRQQLAAGPSQADAHEQTIRTAIVAAATNLPIEQLLEISIPIRFVLQALKGV